MTICIKVNKITFEAQKKLRTTRTLALLALFRMSLHPFAGIRRPAFGMPALLRAAVENRLARVKDRIFFLKIKYSN